MDVERELCKAGAVFYLCTSPGHTDTLHTTNLPTGFWVLHVLQRFFTKDIEFPSELWPSLFFQKTLMYSRYMHEDFCPVLLLHWLLPFRTPLASVVISPELREPWCQLLEPIYREHGWRPLRRFIVSEYWQNMSEIIEQMWQHPFWTCIVPWKVSCHDRVVSIHGPT